MLYLYFNPPQAYIVIDGKKKKGRNILKIFLPNAFTILFISKHTENYE